MQHMYGNITGTLLVWCLGQYVTSTTKELHVAAKKVRR